MALTENIAVFFADFAVIATRIDPAGTAQVMLDQDITDIGLGDFSAAGMNYTATYQVSTLPDLAAGEGLVINGKQYRVINPEISNDGQIAVASLGVY